MRSWLHVFPSSFGALCLLSMFAAPVRAQLATPVAVVRADSASPPPAQPAPLSASTETGAYRGARLPLRMVLGVGGAFVGAFGGALVGSAFPHSRCSCEDPGLAQALIGAAAGSIISAAVFAAVPESGRQCDAAQRVMTGILGGTVGALLGVLAASRSGGVILGYVAGAGFGAGAGAALCHD